jgi:hypothetical protein
MVCVSLREMMGLNVSPTLLRKQMRGKATVLLFEPFVSTSKMRG